MTKPKLSFWQIWNLSFGFLGVQIGYSLQNSNTSSIFESLGADVSHLSYFWLAAPLAGMIVQPIVGLFSDGTWTRWGRRIPYILGGSLISALALVLMPNCPKLLAFAPLAMGAFILLFMDLSFNVTMQPFRALVADMLDDSQKTQGYVVQTFLINLGAVVGAILPLVMTWLGVSDEAAPGHVSPHIAYSYYAGGAILLLTVLVTSFKTREYPPGEFARYNNLSEEDAKPVSFVGLMRNVPGVMVRLGVTQFFSWAALFLMWTYLKPAITGVVTDHATGEVLSAGATQTWVGVLNGTYPIPACIAALFLGRVAARYGNKPVSRPACSPGRWACGVVPAARPVRADAPDGGDRHRLGGHPRHALRHPVARGRATPHGRIHGYLQFHDHRPPDRHRTDRRCHRQVLLRLRRGRHAGARRGLHAAGRRVGLPGQRTQGPMTYNP